MLEFLLVVFVVVVVVMIEVVEVEFVVNVVSGSLKGGVGNIM